jgi:simple sugar transport system permease protein
VAIVLGFGLSFVVAAVVLLLIGISPVSAIRVALDGSVTTKGGLANSLVFATPRLFVALGACVAIQSGVFNLGGEGQLQLGGIGAALVAVLVGPLIGPLHVGLAIAAAAAFGGLWAAIAALLQVWRGANILITSLLMSFVGVFLVQYLVQGPFQESGAVFNQSDRIPASAELINILPGTRLHFGFVLAVLATFGCQVLLKRTSLGMELRAAGFNARAASYFGLSPNRLVVTSMFISGALGGLGGASEILGVHYRLLQGFSIGIGFEGVAIAFLGALKPIPTLFVAIFFGVLQAGVLELQHELDVPLAISLIMLGLPILTLAAARGLVLLREGSEE